MKSIAFFDEHYPVKTVFSDIGDTADFDNWKNQTVRRPVIEKHLSTKFDKVVYARETHSGNICVIRDNNSEGQLLHTDETYSIGEPGGFDSIVTPLKNVFLAVWTADCIPVYLYDPVKQVIAMTHNGWRGICCNIATNTIRIMETEFDSKAENILVAFGPGICGKCYEVGDELYELFDKYFSSDVVSTIFNKKGEKYLLDLKKAVSEELLNAGIIAENIHDTGICSYEDKNYASYRRDGRSGPAMQTLSGIVMI